MGAAAFLTKPFLPNELCEMVDSLLAIDGSP
jgi:DNA-binding response OmpR family regulator